MKYLYIYIRYIREQKIYMKKEDHYSLLMLFYVKGCIEESSITSLIGGHALSQQSAAASLNVLRWDTHAVDAEAVSTYIEKKQVPLCIG
jgi:hypothetical protein